MSVACIINVCFTFIYRLKKDDKINQLVLLFFFYKQLFFVEHNRQDHPIPLCST